jgi:uncharacterized membrane protein YphA (DoxX/SURF4 family)
MVVLRVALGVMLIWKGINFIRDTFVLELLTGQTGQSLFATHEALLILLPSMLTIVGGLFIIAGLFTGIVAVIQLPVFLIGTLFIHAGYIERNGFELVLTGLIPFLLLVFISKADHKLSNDPSVTYKQNKITF